ncbi:OmpA family protein [uncultured Agitococcus sp.]|uniref:OmpA family protein n=1 Tax=uncultured Agitococcus sp. TaxID=1506599 RepID=UPI002631B8C2|nr:OmpA family protein [uncultured Agitococcus sp.]
MTNKSMVLMLSILLMACQNQAIRQGPAPIIPKGQPFVEKDFDETIAITPPQYIFPISPRLSLIPDFDFDGVNDEIDQCLDTPSNVKVDQKGCTIDPDDDKDGIKNSVDKCPNTPANSKVDDKGCPIDGDDDKDGIKNSVDKCPNTPANTKVDDKGCPIDGDDDKDGIKNSKDKCPNTATNTKVDDKGCSLSTNTGGNSNNWTGKPSGGNSTSYSGGGAAAPINVTVTNNNYVNGINQSDKDQDGINDDEDKCPSTPSNTKVDVRGCPVNVVIDDDLDKDGVKNAQDSCPNTPLGTKVDAKGCPLVLLEDVEIKLNVLFATDKATIVDNAFVDILKVADFMRQYPNVTVVIEGHTDDRASIAHNQKLSQRRAEAVRRELIRFGVDARRLLAIGYGELRPIADNTTEQGRLQNRRVVAVAKAQKQ